MTEQNWQEATDETTMNALDEWSDIQAESQIVVEKEGDGWTGRLIEIEPPNRNGIVQAHFENVETIPDGEYVGDAFVNAGRDLERKLRKVPLKSMMRVVWESSMDTGQKTPMRIYKVQWR